MAIWGTLLNALQYAPLVLEVTRALGGKQPEAHHEAPDASQHELDALRKATDHRFEELTGEVNHLRERLRHAEEAVMALQLWVKIGMPSLGILVVILLIVVLSRG
jgi:hypothetical protein